ncbi:hypothetical protein C8F01DRAFT_1376351 [Mycena amicta]|nr:hypothetical protein C8F01DRAFT_1376351 [Mycena amicta]
MTCASCAFSPSPLLPSAAQLEALQSILRFHSIPFPATEAHFRDVVERGPASLAQYDEQIEALREKMDALSAERKLLVTYIEGSRSIVASYIRRLPTELLTRIFEICALESRDDDAGGEEQPENADSEVYRLAQGDLLTLSKARLVCSRWHTTVMGTPGLWSTLRIDLRRWSESQTARNVDLLRSALFRSRTYPLELRFSAPTGATFLTLQVLSLLVEHSNRWRTLAFFGTLSETALTGAKGRLPLLEVLELRPGSKPFLSDVFCGAPRLRSFVFIGNPNHVPPMPWNQLSFFRHRGLGNLQLAPLPLEKLSSSCHCVITGRIDSRSAHRKFTVPIKSPVSRFQLFLLARALEADVNRETLGSVLDSLTFPNLTEFHLHPRPDKVIDHLIWNPTAFSALATRSSFGDRLCCLSIIAVISDSELLAALRDLPNLRHLIIADIPSYPAVVTDHLLLELGTVDDCHRPLLNPGLNEMDIASCLQFTDDALWALLDIRCRNPKCYLEICFRSMQGARRSLGEELMENIYDLQEEGGLDFDITPCSESSWHVARGIR